jgi:hypothetical protein
VSEHLQSRLAEFAREIEFPSTPDLATAVRARIEAEADASAPARRLRAPRSRWAVALAVSLALLGGAGVAAAAVPGVRHAIGDLLGLRGATVERVPRTPPAPAVAGRDLGPRVTLAAAARRAGFRILAAHDALLGEPESVHATGARVTLVYEAGVTLTQVPGSTGRDFIRKLTSPQTAIHDVVVHGEPGLYVDGPHVVMYLDPSRQVVADRARRAGRVLLWQHGPLLLRLEADVSQARALEIARSVR